MCCLIVIHNVAVRNARGLELRYQRCGTFFYKYIHLSSSKRMPMLFAINNAVGHQIVGKVIR